MLNNGGARSDLYGFGRTAKRTATTTKSHAGCRNLSHTFSKVGSLQSVGSSEKSWDSLVLSEFGRSVQRQLCDEKEDKCIAQAEKILSRNSKIILLVC